MRRWSTRSAPCTARALPASSAPAISGRADQEDAVKARGREMVEKGFADSRQGACRQELSRGSELSTADAAVFYVEFWAAGRLGMKLPANVAAHYERMKARPAVQRVMQQEGFA